MADGRPSGAVVAPPLMLDGRGEARAVADEKRAVLCVDDEPLVLEGLQLTLRQHFNVTVCTSGEAALELLARRDDFSVVLSDMRMPGMTGHELLARARTLRPFATRMLLTGHADLPSAMRAINDGFVFRFLTKPCPPRELLAAMRAGTEQYMVARAEHELLDSTLRGAVSALSQALALAAPEVAGRASRAQRLGLAVARRLGLGTLWPLDIALQLYHLGLLSVPSQTVQRALAGEAVTPSERAMLDRAPAMTLELIARIPRLEHVRELLQACGAAPGRQAPEEQQVLWAAIELQRLDATGQPVDRALLELEEPLSPRVHEALCAEADPRQLTTRAARVTIRDLRPGMVLLEDVSTVSGALLMSRGFQLTEVLVERLRNVHESQHVREPVHVRLPTEPGKETPS